MIFIIRGFNNLYISYMTNKTFYPYLDRIQIVIYVLKKEIPLTNFPKHQ